VHFLDGDCTIKAFADLCGDCLLDVIEEKKTWRQAKK
jgi:hypothetical protein